MDNYLNIVNNSIDLFLKKSEEHIVDGSRALHRSPSDPFERCKAEIEYFKYIENLPVNEFYTLEELYTFKEFKWGNPSSKSKDNHGDYIKYIYNISIKEMYEILYNDNLRKGNKYISYMLFLHHIAIKK